ncbi:phage antirepressor N-terminal domain-containing protein [Arthrobacter alpinus]|uniref:phage antirepressor N-terminal domain-containing protein n=1 Tax=Arthrobacter alpinus TaxID=656366 RepID=UPI000944FBFE|nr:phage antirepressor N-terminal domain-containing protein [Arthrobacter alpinus]
MTTLVQIPFHGTKIIADANDGNPLVALRQSCESIGLAYSKQLQKLKNKPWAVVSLRDMTGADGKTYQMSMIDQRTMTMWLATIDVARVSEAARPILIAFQNESTDALDAYFNKGVAVNPRAGITAPNGLPKKTRDQIELLGLARGLVDQNWLEGKARIVLARALDEVPEILDSQIPLYVESYLNEKSGLTAAQAKTLRSIFGRKVSAAYKAHHGRAPQKSPGEVGSRIREINAYIEADRWLFDQVWNDDYEVLFGATFFQELSA